MAGSPPWPALSAPRRQPAVPAHACRRRLRAWLAGALSSPAVRAAPWSSAERGSQGQRGREEPDAAACVAAGAAGAMTVEQNVLQQNAAQKHQQTFLNQLREITGINDAQILQQALKDSNGNLELAVAFLTAKNAKTPQQEEATYYQTALPGNDRYISVGSQADTRKKQYMPARTRCATIEQSKYGSKDKRDLGR